MNNVMQRNHIDQSMDLGEAKIYTMRELNQETARVIQEVNESGEPAAITRHGRFVAILLPAEQLKIESLVLKRDNPAVGGMIPADDEEVPTRSISEIAAEHGVQLPCE